MAGVREPGPGDPGTDDGRTEPPDVRARLDDLIGWYEDQARIANIGHKATRTASILAAAAIPALASTTDATVATGAVLGSVVVALEAVHELFQFQRNWVRYGTTKEALKRERSLHAALAASYRPSRTDDPDRLLIERVEALVATETSGWADLQTSDQRPT